MTAISFTHFQWIARHHVWVAFAAELIVLLLAAWIGPRGSVGRLASWAKHSGRAVDDQFVAAVRHDFVALIRSALKPLLLLGGIAIAVNSLPVPAHILALCNRLFTLAMIVIALYYTYKAVMISFRAWLSSNTASLSLVEPAAFFIRVVFAGLGITILLDNLGVSLKAVWTTLGVGSIAVALALQDTLSNFFAGVYLRLDRPVKLGDYIKLESSEEGRVEHVGWRSTRIKTIPNNVVVIPNSKLASAIVTNYSMPEEQMSLLLPVSVSYDDDPERVEAILLEEAKAAARDVQGLLADPAPYVRFMPGFGDSSLNFTLFCRVATYVDQYLVQHELRKRILARFRAEGIAMPFPQRDVHVYQASNSKQLSDVTGERPISQSGRKIA
jgi:small-conductance mechanosensitive channel